MMFDKLKTINNAELLRLTGINNIIFNKILEILKTEELKKFKKGDIPNKLSLENRLLMTLEYCDVNIEHIGMATLFRTIFW